MAEITGMLHHAKLNCYVQVGFRKRMLYGRPRLLSTLLVNLVHTVQQIPWMFEHVLVIHVNYVETLISSSTSISVWVFRV